jgi:hypothetical protein
MLGLKPESLALDLSRGTFSGRVHGGPQKDAAIVEPRFALSGLLMFIGLRAGVGGQLVSRIRRKLPSLQLIRIVLAWRPVGPLRVRLI